MSRLIILFLLVFAQTALAGNVSIPNSFSDGTTASAPAVNANFDAIESSVNDNDGRITSNTADIQTNEIDIGINLVDIQNDQTAIDANTSSIMALESKTTIGVFVEGKRLGALMYAESDLIHILLGSGYWVHYKKDTFDGVAGIVTGFHFSRNIFYSSGDCTGQAYVRVIEPLQAAQGIVTASRGNSALFYAPPGNTEVINVNSILDRADGTCVATIFTLVGLKAFPNDQSVTGVLLSDFVGDVTLGF